MGGKSSNTFENIIASSGHIVVTFSSLFLRTRPGGMCNTKPSLISKYAGRFLFSTFHWTAVIFRTVSTRCKKYSAQYPEASAYASNHRSSASKSKISRVRVRRSSLLDSPSEIMGILNDWSDRMMSKMGYRNKCELLVNINKMKEKMLSNLPSTRSSADLELYEDKCVHKKHICPFPATFAELSALFLVQKVSLDVVRRMKPRFFGRRKHSRIRDNENLSRWWIRSTTKQAL